MAKVNDLIGKTFGRLIVIERIENDKHDNARWHCLCSCGNTISVRGYSLAAGDTQSCGCYRREINTTHGFGNSPIFGVWRSMMHRCYNKKNKHYSSYGGRGIFVCERWHNVKLFSEDMLPIFKKGLSIDRINNDREYSPPNYRWADHTTQMNNRRMNKLNTSGYRGVTWNKKLNKWRASVQKNAKFKHIGYFLNKIEAAQARDNYIKKNNLASQLNFK